MIKLDIADQIEEHGATLRACLESANEADSNLEIANVVDGLFFIGRAIHRLAAAVEKVTCPTSQSVR
jgi:hypothetical protein